jgi:hypothetical protein
LVKDIVYTDVYNKKYIENWSERLNKICRSKAMEMIFVDDEVSMLAKKFISYEDSLDMYIEGGI